jgi:NAD(P)-dependent dehydrogenase (short-subunit alcohol dehydrogenase family)
MVDEVVKRFGTIDILVNNAGATWGAPAEEYPDEAWRKVMTLNIDAMFWLSREVGRRCMIPRKGGKIVNVASIAGLYGGPPDMHTIAYNTSKGAAVNFTRALASEWGPHNINVNAVCPGFFPTKMARGVLERVGDRVIAATPLKRLGGDTDLKGVVVFLASEASRHVTGQCIPVDGGVSVT